MKIINTIKSRFSMKPTSTLSKNIKVWVDCFGDTWIAKSKISSRKKTSDVLNKQYPWANRPSSEEPSLIAHYLISEFKFQFDNDHKYIGCNIPMSRYITTSIADFIYNETRNKFWDDVKTELEMDKNYKQFVKWNYLYRSLKEELKDLEKSKKYYNGQEVKYGKEVALILNKMEEARLNFELVKNPWESLELDK